MASVAIDMADLANIIFTHDGPVSPIRVSPEFHSVKFIETGQITAMFVNYYCQHIPTKNDNYKNSKI